MSLQQHYDLLLKKKISHNHSQAEITAGDATFHLSLYEQGEPCVGISGVMSSIRTGINYNITPTNSSGTSITLLPADTYFLILNLPTNYSLKGFVINDFDSTNDEIYDPYVNKSTIFGIDLIDFTVSYVSATIDVTSPPQLIEVLINSGDEQASESLLTVSLDYVGKATEYMISETPDFIGKEWLPFPGSIFTYEKSFISDITVTLYVKLRNALGESDMQSDSILLTQPFSRSDSAAKYSSIVDAVDAIITDYPSGLTQDVEITCVGKFTEVRSHSPYQCEIMNFNKGTAFSLTINGNNKYTLDCYSLGGFYVFNSASIIFKNIVFKNVASELTNSVPEELGAISIQGNADNINDSIVIDNVNIDCKHTVGTSSQYGDYGVLAYWVNNLTVTNSIFANQRACAVKGDNLKAFSLIKNTFGGYMSTRSISQPALVWVTKFYYGYIGDCTFNGNSTNTYGKTYDTGAILNGLNITIERCMFTNIGSDALRLSSILPGKTIYIHSCVFINNLIAPRYSYSKQDVGISGSFEKLILVHNTIIMTGVGKTQTNESFIRSYNGVISLIEIHNNIIDFNFPGFTNNSASAYFLNIDSPGALVSSNNYFRDNTQPDSTGKPTGRIRNYIMTSTSSYPQYRFMNSLDPAFTESGSLAPYDSNSKFLPLDANLFASNGYSPTAWAAANIPADPSYLHTYDFYYKTYLQSTLAGAVWLLGENVNEDTTTVVFYFNNTANGLIIIEDNDPFESNSATPVLIYANSINRSLTPKLTITTELGSFILIGRAAYVALFSKLLPDGTYDADLVHSVNYLGVERFIINVLQRLPIANFKASNYFPVLNETVSLDNLSIEADTNTWALRGGKETALTEDASATLIAIDEGEQKLTIANTVGSSIHSKMLYISPTPEQTYASININKEVVRIQEQVTITPNTTSEIPGTTYAYSIIDKDNVVIAQGSGPSFSYTPTMLGCFDVVLESTVNGKMVRNRQNKLLTVTPQLAAINGATIINITTAYYSYNGASISPGTTLVVNLLDYSTDAIYRIKFANLTGTAEQPIIITFNNTEQIIFNFSSYWGIDIENCKHVILDGRGYNNLQYGIHITKLDSTPTAEVGVRLGDTGSSDIQIFGFEVSKTTFAGMNCKTDPDVNKPQYWRGTFFQNNIWMHHNYIHETTGEGIYFGYFSVDPITKTNNQGQQVTYRAHELVDCKIYRNIFKKTGWDAIQLNNATGNAEICYNDIEDSAYLPAQDQSTFMSVSMNGKIYNNRMVRCGGLGIQFGAQGPNLDIFNNIITKIAYNNPALLILSSLNCPEQKPDDGQTVINTRTTFKIYNNTIIADGGFLRARVLVDYINTFTKNNLYKVAGNKYFGPTADTIAQWNTNSEGDIILDLDNQNQKIADVTNDDFNIAIDSSLTQSGVIYENTYDFRGFQNWYLNNKFSGAFAGVRKLSSTSLSLDSVLINNAENPNVMSVNILLHLTYQGQPTEALVSEAADFSEATWSPLQTPHPFILSNGDGVKTVYVKLRNESLIESNTMNATCTLITVRKILIDLGRSGFYASSPNWNNFGGPTAGVTVAFGTSITLKYFDDYSDSPYSLSVKNEGVEPIISLDGYNPATPGIYPISATRDNLIVAKPNYSVLEVSGLDNNKTYDFKCYGSKHTISGVTRFTIQGVAIPLDTKNNLNNTANFMNLTPVDGKIDIRWEFESGTTNGFFNVLEIAEHI